jgi:tetratricopeptide (TPR) repeat protein
MFSFLRPLIARFGRVRASSIKNRLAVLLLLSASCIPFAASQSHSAKTRITPGLNASFESWLGELSNAIAHFQEQLQLHPSDMQAEIGLARAYSGVNNFDEARRILEQSRRKHPHSAEPLASLGALDIEMQSYDEAIRHLNAALSLHPADIETRDRLAVAYKAKNDFPNALAQVAKVLARDPKNALAYFTRAVIYSNQNQDVPALRDAEKVVALQPDNEHGLLLLGKILLRVPDGASPAAATARCSRSVQVLERLVFGPPEGTHIAFSTDIYVPPDDPDNLYNPSVQSNDSESLFLLSRAYDCAGQSDKARKTLADFETASQKERSEKENQTQARHLVEQANALAMKNDFPGAMDLLQQALAKEPENSAAFSQLAKIYYSEGDLEKAGDAIDHALVNHGYQPDFLYVRGKILEKEGKLDQALTEFRDTALVDPKESDAYFEMGVIYQQKNDREHALAAYKKAVELSPDDPDYKRALASIQ